MANVPKNLVALSNRVTDAFTSSCFHSIAYSEGSKQDASNSGSSVTLFKMHMTVTVCAIHLPPGGMADLDQQSDHSEKQAQRKDHEGTQHVLHGEASTPAPQPGSPVV
jgi:hypothetical protein